MGEYAERLIQSEIARFSSRGTKKHTTIMGKVTREERLRLNLDYLDNSGFDYLHNKYNQIISIDGVLFFPMKNEFKAPKQSRKRGDAKVFLDYIKERRQ